MILYTTMPQELIYEQEYDSLSSHIMVEDNGVPLLVSEVSNGEYEVVRILSSNPQHFLDTRYNPGAKLKL